MEEILDHDFEKKPTKIFSILSFGFSILTGIIIYHATAYSNFVKIKELTPPPPYLLILLHASCLLGLICAFLSIWKKEKTTIFKVLGITLSSLIALIIYGSIFYAYYIDNLQ